MDECYSDSSSDDVLPDAVAGAVQRVTRDGGVQKKCLVEGEGHARPPRGARVRVHWVGTLAADGSRFDSSRESGEPFEFELGLGQVARGWDEGVATMCKGEKSVLTCTAKYAYGDAGTAKVPGGATVCFELELESWVALDDCSEERDRSILKTLIARGEGHDPPDYESKVTIDIEGPSFSKKDWTIVIGDDMVPPGVEKAVRCMREGEESSFLIGPQHLGNGDWGELPLAPGREGEYRIVLKRLERAKSQWALQGREKIEVALKAKEEGNELYKSQKLRRAQQKYKKAADILGEEYGCDADLAQEMRELRVPCLTNLAAAELALEDWQGCIEHCGKALEVDSACVKALLRRAKAYNATDEWQLCRADLLRIVGDDGLDPENREAKRELERLQKKVRAQDAKDRKTFSNMFAKLASTSAKGQDPCGGGCSAAPPPAADAAPQQP